MLKRVLTVCVGTGLLTVPVAAGQAPPRTPGTEMQSQAPPAQGAPEARRRNVSIELTISDQTGASEPLKKVVTMIVADRQMGSVRSSGNVAITPEGNGAPPMIERRAVALN